MNHEQLRQQSQQRLIEFLTTELDLAHTFIGMARQHHADEARQHSLDAARKGLEAIRHFEGRVVDEMERARIHKSASELDRLLAEF